MVISRRSGLKCPEFVHENRCWPEFYRVVSNFPHSPVSDTEAVVHKALENVLDTSGIKDGDRVAVGVGSRNIAGLAVMVRVICQRIRELGAVPVIVPAMGSHGGAESQGQIRVLEDLGISEKTCGAAVVSSLDVDQIDTVLDGIPVWFSRDALAMDHSVVINRVKPHTKFKAPVESGIYKMMCIGMGKHRGAAELHQAALRHGFYPVIRAAGDAVIRHSNIRFAVAVVENQHGEPVEIRAMAAEDFFSEESRLLELARSCFPRLPFKHLDALVIGRIGKDISGSGMDPNVTGRAYDLMEDDFSINLKATRIALLDLSDKSGGNAIGLGNADIITEKLFRKMDYQKTLINALTSTSLRKAFIPIRMDDDESAMKTAFFSCGVRRPEDLRAVIIRDTRHATEFWATSALLDELIKIPGVTVHEKVALSFSAEGDLLL